MSSTDRPGMIASRTSPTMGPWAYGKMGDRRHGGARNAPAASRALSSRAGRRVREGQLDVSGPVDLDDERDSSLGIAKGKGLARVLVRDRIHEGERRIGPAFHDAAAELRLPVWIGEIHERERDPRIAAGISRLQRFLPRTDDDPVALAPHPDGST